MFKHEFQFPKTGRYFSLQPIQGDEQDLWIVLHGYKQLASFFIKKFDVPESDGFALVAPEGMHRFYLTGYNGRVGASWMTREERESDIADYVRALDILVDEVLTQFKTPPRINVLGFSQGAATATRWLCRGRTKANRLVLWAGSFPPDVNYDSDVVKLNAMNLTLVIGDQDQFIQADDIIHVKELLDQHQVQYQLHKFQGGHDIDAAVLGQLLKNQL